MTPNPSPTIQDIKAEAVRRFDERFRVEDPTADNDYLDSVSKFIESEIDRVVERAVEDTREAQECLMDMWNQFAYEGKTKRGKETKWSGGLSALEGAEFYLKKHGLLDKNGQPRYDLLQRLNDMKEKP